MLLLEKVLTFIGYASLIAGVAVITYGCVVYNMGL